MILCLGVVAVTGLTLGLVMLRFGEPLMGLYNSDPGVIASVGESEGFSEQAARDMAASRTASRMQNVRFIGFLLSA